MYEVNFSTEAILTYKPVENFKTYLGLSYSMDGCSLMFGFKIAGVKLVVPWNGFFNIFRRDANDIVEEEMGDPLEIIVKNFGVSILFMGASFLCSRTEAARREKQSKQWIETELPKLFSRHIVTLKMIQKAARNQQAKYADKLFIHAAFYGRRTAIEEYILRRKHNPESLKRGDVAFDAGAFVDVPEFVLDVTIPVRFTLDFEKGLVF